jgi:hypothetical protein
MADRNQLKKAPEKPIAEDDPFAELTRIMGFDPRVPVTPRQPPAMEKLAALAAQEDDFSIDLEKELMGEFDGLEEDVEVTSYAAAQVAHDQDNAPVDNTTVDDFDFVFDADVVAPEQDPAITAAAHQALADELDAAFGGEPVSESVAVEADAVAFASEIPDEPVIPEVVPAAVREDEVLADEFDAAFDSEAEEPAPFQAAQDDLAAGEIETVYADNRVAEEHAAAVEDGLADEVGETFAAHFNDHLTTDIAEQPIAAEPEMQELAVEAEFLTEPDLVSESEFVAVAAEVPESIAEAAQTDDDAEDAPLIPLGAARDLAHADEHFASIDMNFETGLTSELSQSFDASSAVGEAEDDYDLESELSALLGKGKSVAAPVVAPAMAAAAVQDEPAYSADEPAVSMDDWSADHEDPQPMVAEAVAEEMSSEPEYLAADETAEADVEPYFDEPLMADEHDDEFDADTDYQPAEAPAYAAEQPAYAPASYAAVQPAAYAATDQAAYAPGEAPAPYATPDYAEGPAEIVAETMSWEESGQEEDDPLSEFVVEQELEAELAGLEDDIDLGLDDLVLDDEPVVAASAEQPVILEQPQVTKVAFAPLSAPKAPVEAEEEDPFALLAAMVRDTPPVAQQPVRSPASASMRFQDLPRSEAPKVSETSVTQYQYQSRSYANRVPVNVPDIDTIDVPETAVALADDLDIPDFTFEDDLPPATDFDDFEAELASAFNPQPISQSAAEPVRDVPRQAYQHEYAQSQPQPTPAEQGYYDAAVASTAYAPVQPARQAAYADDHHVAPNGHTSAGGQAEGAYRAVDDDDLAYDPELNEHMAIPAYHEAAERQPSGNRRGLMMAAIVGGVVLIGGVSAYALFGGGGGSDAPAVVLADTDPVKVRPENPGGTNVPNQDNKVFQTMNGTDRATGPTQEKLISGTEEPVDVAARAAPQPSQDSEAAIEDAPLTGDDEMAVDAQDPVAAEIAAAPKGEDRLAQEATTPTANNEVAAVAPRRVRTMVVRADGTLVPSEAPAPVAAEPQADQATVSALEPADPSKSLADPIATDATGSLTPAAPAETAAAAPVAPATQAAMPDSGPVAPSRPADQPVDVVGEVKPQQVAATTGAAAAGSWSMQIASQPSEAAAQSSYQDLARRYGSVIGDKGVNIVKAEIAGKGTFWRVRVPAGSRNDAISLCESYKAAGGNCFVSK